ncbi:MAG TPA: branched-chain amino acid ABC transporter permease [Clostridia bacterium]|nr:branched-chain amino acid ABC transporter permease [Clostridia bacterium]
MLIQLIIGSLMIGSVYGLLALGYSLIYKASGQMTFVQGELLMLGAFLGLTFYGIMGLPFLVALLLTVVIMFIFGMLIEKFLIRILLKRGATGIYIVLATIGLSILLQNAAMLIWGSRVFQFPSIFGKSLINIGGINIVPESLLALGVSLLCMVALHIFMSKTKFGTSMRAAAQDPMAASSLGINVPFTTAVTWGLSSALAGIAGIMIGPMYGVSITMGSMVGLKGFAGSVIGGYGDMYGAIVGSTLLGFIETFVAGYISSVFKDFISFFVLIVIMIFMPTGLFKSKVYD